MLGSQGLFQPFIGLLPFGTGLEFPEGPDALGDRTGTARALVVWSWANSAQSEGADAIEPAALHSVSIQAGIVWGQHWGQRG